MILKAREYFFNVIVFLVIVLKIIIYVTYAKLVYNIKKRYIQQK